MVEPSGQSTTGRLITLGCCTINARAPASVVTRAWSSADRRRQVVPWRFTSRAPSGDRIQASRANGIAFAIINPGAFTHTSVAMRDALLGVKLPFIELHLSNVFAREKFRHHSYFSDIAVGCIVGLGAQGYELAVQAAAARIASSPAR